VNWPIVLSVIGGFVVGAGAMFTLVAYQFMKAWK